MFDGKILQNLAAKNACCKDWKIQSCEVCKFSMFVLRVEKLTIFAPNVENFSAHDTNISKICKLRKNVFSSIYSISQPNFCSFTDFKVLFLAVVKDFVCILPKSKFTFSWEERAQIHACFTFSEQ